MTAWTWKEFGGIEHEICPGWWLFRVTSVVGFVFLPQNLGLMWGPMSAICHSLNVDGVVILLGV